MLKFKIFRLHKYGISIHLLQKDSGDSNTPNKQSEINPKSNHISFQVKQHFIVVKINEDYLCLI